MRESSYEKLLPPLVHELRRKVKAWRENAYDRATNTSIYLANWWLNREHLMPMARWQLLSITLPSVKHLGVEVAFTQTKKEDFISITDIAKYKNPAAPADIIKTWLRSKNTIELLGL